MGMSLGLATALSAKAVGNQTGLSADRTYALLHDVTFKILTGLKWPFHHKVYNVPHPQIHPTFLSASHLRTCSSLSLGFCLLPRLLLNIESTPEIVTQTPCK